MSVVFLVLQLEKGLGLCTETLFTVPRDFSEFRSSFMR